MKTQTIIMIGVKEKLIHLQGLGILAFKIN